jgi:hypothetical protein
MCSCNLLLDLWVWDTNASIFSVDGNAFLHNVQALLSIPNMKISGVLREYESFKSENCNEQKKIRMRTDGWIRVGKGSDNFPSWYPIYMYDRVAELPTKRIRSTHKVRKEGSNHSLSCASIHIHSCVASKLLLAADVLSLFSTWMSCVRVGVWRVEAVVCAVELSERINKY